MSHKKVLFRSAAREKILRGAPRSKSVLIEKKWGAPVVCNDGVTIAKEFDLKDPEENLGARMLRQGCGTWSRAPVRIALENAVSVASVLLLTEATVTDVPEPVKERVAEPEMSM